MTKHCYCDQGHISRDLEWDHCEPACWECYYNPPVTRVYGRKVYNVHFNEEYNIIGSKLMLDADSSKSCWTKQQQKLYKLYYAPKQESFYKVEEHELPF